MIHLAYALTMYFGLCIINFANGLNVSQKVKLMQSVKCFMWLKFKSPRFDNIRKGLLEPAEYPNGTDQDNSGSLTYET